VNLLEQAEAPEPEALAFDGGRRAVIPGWAPRTDEGEATFEEIEGEDGRRVYVIGCAGDGPVRASFRVAVRLDSGRYRLSGLALGRGIEPLDDEQGRGAGLRVSGDVRDQGIEHDGEWEALAHAFTVEAPGRVELVAELRATAGSVRFNAESLALERLSDP